MGLLWYAEKKYNDFVLKIDWKVNRKNDNSGIFVRFSDPDNDPWIAVNTGYEIQIDDLAMPETVDISCCQQQLLTNHHKAPQPSSVSLYDGMT
jgi:3-keto-disaccharide hydrolase